MFGSKKVQYRLEFRIRRLVDPNNVLPPDHEFSLQWKNSARSAETGITLFRTLDDGVATWSESVEEELDDSVHAGAFELAVNLTQSRRNFRKYPLTFDLLHRPTGSSDAPKTWNKSPSSLDISPLLLTRRPVKTATLELSNRSDDLVRVIVQFTALESSEWEIQQRIRALRLDWDRKVNVLQRENDRLKSQVTDLEESLESQRGVSKRHIQKLETESRAAQLELQDQLDDVTREKDRNRRGLEKSRREVERLQEELRKCRRQAALAPRSPRTPTRSGKVTFQQQQAEVTQEAEESAESMAGQLALAKLEAKEAQSQLASRETFIDHLQNERSSLRSELIDLKKQFQVFRVHREMEVNLSSSETLRVQEEFSDAQRDHEREIARVQFHEKQALEDLRRTIMAENKIDRKEMVQTFENEIEKLTQKLISFSSLLMCQRHIIDSILIFAPKPSIRMFRFSHQTFRVNPNVRILDLCLDEWLEEEKSLSNNPFISLLSTESSTGSIRRTSGVRWKRFSKLVMESFYSVFDHSMNGSDEEICVFYLGLSLLILQKVKKVKVGKVNFNWSQKVQRFDSEILKVEASSFSSSSSSSSSSREGSSEGVLVEEEEQEEEFSFVVSLLTFVASAFTRITANSFRALRPSLYNLLINDKRKKIRESVEEVLEILDGFRLKLEQWKIPPRIVRHFSLTILSSLDTFLFNSMLRDQMSLSDVLAIRFKMSFIELWIKENWIFVSRKKRVFNRSNQACNLILIGDSRIVANEEDRLRVCPDLSEEQGNLLLANNSDLAKRKALAEEEEEGEQEPTPRIRSRMDSLRVRSLSEIRNILIPDRVYVSKFFDENCDSFVQKCLFDFEYDDEWFEFQKLEAVVDIPGDFTFFHSMLRKAIHKRIPLRRKRMEDYLQQLHAKDEPDVEEVEESEEEEEEEEEEGGEEEEEEEESEEEEDASLQLEFTPVQDYDSIRFVLDEQRGIEFDGDLIGVDEIHGAAIAGEDGEGAILLEVNLGQNSVVEVWLASEDADGFVAAIEALLNE